MRYVPIINPRLYLRGYSRGVAGAPAPRSASGYRKHRAFHPRLSFQTGIINGADGIAGWIFAEWCNGNTNDSDSFIPGSNPGSAASKETSFVRRGKRGFVIGSYAGSWYDHQSQREPEEFVK